MTTPPNLREAAQAACDDLNNEGGTIALLRAALTAPDTRAERIEEALQWIAYGPGRGPDGDGDARRVALAALTADPEPEQAVGAFPPEPTTPEQRWDWAGRPEVDYPNAAMVPGPGNTAPDAYCPKCWKCHGGFSTVMNRRDASVCCQADPPVDAPEECPHYWGKHHLRCLRELDHGGEHWWPDGAWDEPIAPDEEERAPTPQPPTEPGESVEATRKRVAFVHAVVSNTLDRDAILRSLDEARAAGEAEGRRAEQEKSEIRNACACDIIEQKYGGDSDVWKDVHAAFCEPSPLEDTPDAD